MQKPVAAAFRGKATGTREALLFIFALAALSQLGFHLLRPALGPIGLEGECGSAGAAASPLCAELSLFKSWEADAGLVGLGEPDDDDLEALLDAGGIPVGETLHPFGLGGDSSEPSVQAAEPMASREGLELRSRTAASVQDVQVAAKAEAVQVDMAAWAELWALHTRVVSRMSQLRLVKDMVATMEDGPEASNASSWASELVEQQKELEVRAQALMDALAPDGTPREASADSGLPLVERVAALGKELCSDPERRAYPACAQFLEVAGSDGGLRAEEAVHAKKIAPTTVSSTTAQTFAAEVDMAAWGEVWTLQARVGARVSQLRLIMDMVSTMEDGPEARNATALASDLMSEQKDLEKRAQTLLDMLAPRRSPSEASTDSNISLTQRIMNAGRELCLDPERRAYPSCVQFLEVAGSHGDIATRNVSQAAQQPHTSMKPRSTEVDMAAWAEVWALQARVASRMSQLRLVKDMVATMEDGPEASNATSWASELVEQQKELEVRAQALMDALAPDGTPREASADSGLPVAERVAALGKELCSDPERREYPACAQFLEAARSDGGLGAEEAVHAAKTASAAVNSSGGARAALSWPAVTSWKEAPDPSLRGIGPVLMSREELQAARWSGKIPKVACISVVPFGMASATAWQMRDVVDNFLSQQYEGPRQLVLVYHHTDRAAAKLVEHYADGSFIRGAAARGDTNLPSATAFRFGAYVSDGDAVARWDFGAWHHPKRLSLQVRALALGARPASRLRMLTDGAAEAPRADADEASLVGEARWMTEHWRPLLGEASAAHPGRHLAELEMPELLVQLPVEE